MEIPDNISPTIALAGILSGIFLFALSLLLFHTLLQRRKAKARLGSRPHAAHNHQRQQQQAQSSWTSFSFPSRRRRSRSRSRSRSDSESDTIASEDGEGGKDEKTNDRRPSRGGGSQRGASESSLYLEPNQPLHVDVESESSDRCPHPGMQFILTPPTPGK